MDLDATVRGLAPKLLGYCTLETRDPAVAEEIAQDALTALVQRWRRLGPPDSPAAFVFAIARRRSARAAVRRRLWMPLELVLDHRDRGASPEQQAVDRGERERLSAGLARLRGADRQVLLLASVAEMSMEEIAALLGISVSAAKMRASRARQRLRTLLEDGHGTAGRRA